MSKHKNSKLYSDLLSLQITVLQIDALKKVKKGTKILLLDKNGGTAKDVARGLGGKGYKNGTDFIALVVNSHRFFCYFD